MKKRLSAILSLTLVILLLAVQCPISVFALGQASIAEAIDGVAVLVSVLQEGNNATYGSRGSCFFVGQPDEDPQFLLTSYSTISDYLQYGKGVTGSYSIDGKIVEGKMILRVYFSELNYAEAYVRDYDKIQDIALLSLSEPTELRKALPLSVPDKTMIASDVYALGYPQEDTPDALSNTGNAPVVRVPISSLYTESGTGARFIQLGASELRFGYEGGPAINEYGNVLAMVSHPQDSSNNSIWIAANADAAITMLQRNNVSFLLTDAIPSEPEEEAPTSEETAPTVDDEASDQAGGDVENAVATADGTADQAEVQATVTPATPENTGLPTDLPDETAQEADANPPAEVPVAPEESSTAVEPGEGEGDVATADSGETVEVAEGEADSSSTDESAEPAAGFTFKPWMIAAAAALVLFMLIIIFASRKKKPQAVIHAYVTSLAAQHSGRRFEVGSEPILIGREQKCAIMFYAKTPGVSHVHCSLSWDEAAQEFILTDLDSSNGTFLENGQRLMPHSPVRVKSGTIFFLGDRANSLRLDTSKEG